MDQNTIAKMTAALEYVCKKIPPDKDSNALRKRIGDAGQADFPHPACMGLCLSRRHDAISVVLCHSILLFDLRRKHSFVPTAYLHRRRAQRRSRTALLLAPPKACP